MSTLYGKVWKHKQLLQYAGDIRQIADVRLSELIDGPGVVDQKPVFSE